MNIFPVYMQGIPHHVIPGSEGHTLQRLLEENARLSQGIVSASTALTEETMKELELLRQCFAAACKNSSLIWDQEWSEARKKYEEFIGGKDGKQ